MTISSGDPNMDKRERFSEHAIRSFGKIICDYFDDDVSELFARSGYPGLGFIGVSVQEFAASTLTNIQQRAGGDPERILGIIRTMCDPQAHIGNTQELEQMRGHLNELLAFYGWRVTEEGKIIEAKEAVSVLAPPAAPNEKLFDGRCFHRTIVEHGRQHFALGAFSHAVFECCKAFDCAIHKIAGIDESGQSLMCKALNPTGPVKINAHSTQSERDEQQGFMYLCMGLMNAIRNPRGHEPESTWPTSCEDALDVLSLISFLFRRLESTGRVAPLTSQ